MKITYVFLYLTWLGLQVCNAQTISGWREKDRIGVSTETVLLKSWPEGGPGLLWTNLDLPKGNSSVSFSSE